VNQEEEEGKEKQVKNGKNLGRTCSFFLTFFQFSPLKEENEILPHILPHLQQLDRKGK